MAAEHVTAGCLPGETCPGSKKSKTCTAHCLHNVARWHGGRADSASAIVLNTDKARHSGVELPVACVFQLFRGAVQGGSGRNGHARVRSASGPRPFLQILSCAPRPVRVRSASAAVFPSGAYTGVPSQEPPPPE
eukprot:gene8936-biopygen19682